MIDAYLYLFLPDIQWNFQLGLKGQVSGCQCLQVSNSFAGLQKIQFSEK